MRSGSGREECARRRPPSPERLVVAAEGGGRGAEVAGTSGAGPRRGPWRAGLPGDVLRLRRPQTAPPPAALAGDASASFREVAGRRLGYGRSALPRGGRSFRKASKVRLPSGFRGRKSRGHRSDATPIRRSPCTIPLNHSKPRYRAAHSITLRCTCTDACKCGSSDEIGYLSRRMSGDLV